MATDSPPTFFFNGINFNPTYYENEVNNNITQSAGDARYLEKLGDTATGLIAFNSGLSSSGAITSTGTTYATGIIANKIDCTGSIATVFLDVSGSGNNGIRTNNGSIYSTGSGNISTNTGNISTTTGSISGGPLSCTTITSNNNTITAGSSSVTGGSIISSTFNSGGVGSVLDIGANQTNGILSIGNNASRTGAINIGTLTTGAHTINIGNSTSTQTININRPLTTNTINTNNNTLNTGTGSISGGALSCTTINTNNNTFTSGTGSITGGALSCTTITSNNNTISAGTSSVSGGSIISSTFNSDGIGSVLDIGTNQTTGVLSIGNNASRTGAINIGTLSTGAHAINIGNSASTQTININRPLTTNTINTNNNTFTSGTGSITGGALSCTTITSNNNTITAGSSSVTGGSIISSTFNSGGIGSVLDIGANQTTGVLSIGNNASRTGAINIGTLSTGAHAINIGNSTSTQTININRPLTTNTINTNNNNFTSGTGSITGGALSCTTINTNNNNFTSGTGSITGGALSCTTITSNNNTITAGSSSVTGGSIISSTFNSGGIGSVLDIGANQTTGVLSIGNNASRTGAINIGTLSTGAHAINIGNSTSTQTININRPLTTSTINSGAINANAGLIETTGSLKSRGLTIQDTTPSDVASISNTGEIVSTSLITGSIVCNSITAGFGNVSSGSVTTINMKSSSITSLALTSDLYIGTDITTGDIDIGNLTLSTGKININRPLDIAYTSLPSTTSQIGGVAYINSGSVSLSSNTSKTLCSFYNLPLGVYMLSYSIRLGGSATTAGTISITQENVAITASINNFIGTNGIISLRKVTQTGSTPGGSMFLNYHISNTGIFSKTLVAEEIHLTVNFTFTTTGTTFFFADGDLRLVRIG